MQPFIKIIFICCGTLIFWSCQKEYSYEGGIISPPANGSESIVKSEWEFTANTSLYKGPVDTAYLTKEGVFTVLTLTGKTSNGNEFISIKLKTTDSLFQKGKTYKTYLDQAKFIYQNETDTIYSAILYSGGDLYVTISAIDANKVMATFQGEAINEAGQSISITGGHFSSPIKKGLQSTNGYVMLWAKVLCNGPINVSVNKSQGTIEKSFSSAPDCGESGTATYNLPEGFYNWTAYCGNDSLTGNINVTAGNCAKVLIDFPYMPAPVTNTDKNCKLSEIIYEDPNIIPLDKKLGGNHVINNYNGIDVTALKYYVSPAPFIVTHNVTHNNDTIYIDADNQYTRYFITDAMGRVILYHGTKDPGVIYPLPPEIQVTYTYDNQNQLIKRQTFNPANLNLVSEIFFIWKNGNIISTIEKSSFSAQPNIANYQYYNKQVKAMPFVNSDAYELLFYQSLVNFGNPCNNLLKQKILQTPGGAVTFDYDGYLIDDNDYVFSCRMSHNAKHLNFQFNYQCF